MKKTLKTACALAALLGLPSCSYLGLHSQSHLEELVSYAQQDGLRRGRAAAVRETYHREQAELALPEPEPEKVWYSVPIPAHRNSEGVIIEAHNAPIQIVRP